MSKKLFIKGVFERTIVTEMYLDVTGWTPEEITEVLDDCYSNEKDYEWDEEDDNFTEHSFEMTLEIGE